MTVSCHHIQLGKTEIATAVTDSNMLLGDSVSVPVLQLPAIMHLYRLYSALTVDQKHAGLPVRNELDAAR